MLCCADLLPYCSDVATFNVVSGLDLTKLEEPATHSTPYIQLVDCVYNRAGCALFIICLLSAVSRGNSVVGLTQQIVFVLICSAEGIIRWIYICSAIFNTVFPYSRSTR